MKIKVEVKNDILGDSVFWLGESERISDIKNMPAREIAMKVAIDGKPRVLGMWHVSVLQEQDGFDIKNLNKLLPEEKEELNELYNKFELAKNNKA